MKFSSTLLKGPHRYTQRVRIHNLKILADVIDNLIQLGHEVGDHFINFSLPIPKYIESVFAKSVGWLMILASIVNDRPSQSFSPPEEPLDIAPFARVVTWDPNRTDGCRSSRVEEFPAEELFLESDILPAGDGTYTVPVAPDGLGCIGLQWFERRRLKEIVLQFTDSAHIPSPDGVQVQGWFGESLWQGNWKPLKGMVEQQKDRWVFRVDSQGNPKVCSAGVEKVRWIFPRSSESIVLRRLQAFTYSSCGSPRRAERLSPLPIPQSSLVRLYFKEIGG